MMQQFHAFSFGAADIELFPVHVSFYISSSELNMVGMSKSRSGGR